MTVKVSLIDMLWEAWSSGITTPINSMLLRANLGVNYNRSTSGR